ncbi:MAG TPA: hypothetical protein VFZ21_28285 [Gemmatimonadaceae bacterium]|jgi:hypothetical protein|nr:hypothetical protein [Gemmatimonadaceae bacterium]
MDEMDRRNVGDDPTIMGNDVQRDEATDDRDVTARPVRDDEPTTANYVGEAAGGISGGLAGAAIGSIGGPIGTLIGGLAGVVGGWWAGRSIAEAAKDYGDEDDSYYRTHYETGDSRLADRSYDDVRPAYQLGHLASRNPDYRGRSFDEVETDLRRGWSDDIGTRHGDWASVRGYAREAYSRGSTLGATSAGAVDTSVRTNDQLNDMGERASSAADRVATGLEAGVDNVKDRIDGNPASRPGLDATDARAGGRNFAERTADTVRDPDDRLPDPGTGIGDAARRGANRIADAADNVKDRIDGNPASRPGPDPTDRRP